MILGLSGPWPDFPPPGAAEERRDAAVAPVRSPAPPVRSPGPRAPGAEQRRSPRVQGACPLAARFFSSVALTILALLACPALATAADPPPSSDACPTVPPHGYVVELGYGRGNEAQALSAARDEALQRVIDKVCAGLSEARCNGIRRSVSPWEDGRYDRRTRSACAAVAFPQDKLDALQREAADLDRSIAALAAEVGSMEVDLLRHESPVWESGCAAGEVGAYLDTTFDGALGRAGVRLDRDERLHAGASRFHMELAPGPAGVRVTGYLQRPGETGWTAVQGPKFALDLFGVESAEQGQCAPDERLGLRGGQRTILGMTGGFEDGWGSRRWRIFLPPPGDLGDPLAAALLRDERRPTRLQGPRRPHGGTRR